LLTPTSLAYRQWILSATRELLADGLPRRAREIAAALSTQGRVVERRDVSSVLYREGAGQFQCDDGTYQYPLRRRPEATRLTSPRPEPARQRVSASYPRCAGTCTVMVIDSDGILESRPCSCPWSRRNLR
jgi:hypothetical protein